LAQVQSAFASSHSSSSRLSKAMALSFVVLAATLAQVAASPCDGIYGAEALTCVWEADATSCIESECKGCGGEQCQLCRADSKRIHACCEKHWHSATPPTMCINAEAEEGVASCMEAQCSGCGGEQCQLCREDAERISQCCSEYDVAAQPDVCKTQTPDTSDPCKDLWGAEGLTCVWEVDAKSCIEQQCRGCSGEQCQLCQEDSKNVHKCCEEHWHSTTPPTMCAKAEAEEGMTTCMEEQCRGCGGEQCQLCREDASRISECCSQHDAGHLSTACAARLNEKVLLP